MTAIALQPTRPTRALRSNPELRPFIKWPGGKSDELGCIARAAPDLEGRFIDPFVGGGSVLLAAPSEVPAWANDACDDLVDLYRAVATRDAPTRSAIAGVAAAWGRLGAFRDLYEQLMEAFLTGSDLAVSAIVERSMELQLRQTHPAGPGLDGTFRTRLAVDLPLKFQRMRRVQREVGRALSVPDVRDNVEAAVRSCFYMAIRHRYNDARRKDRRDAYRTADFLFLREFAYAAMFRFNARGEFNVPYGGISYNGKSLGDKLSLMYGTAMVERLENTEWRSQDFEPFLTEVGPTAHDFVFVDPPYDSDFSAYDNRRFDTNDQVRLRDVLERLPARIMVVIKDTPLIRSLYCPPRWAIKASSKTYMWTIKSRNDRETTHLTITNY